MTRLTVAEQVRFNRGFAFSLALSLFVWIGSLLLGSFNQICTLCQIQRLLFLLIGSTAAVGIFISSKRLINTMIMFLNCAVFAVACYHLAIQLGLVYDPCSIKSFESLEKFKQTMLSKQTPCNIITDAFGIPLSAWSGLLSLLGLTVAVNTLIKEPSSDP